MITSKKLVYKRAEFGGEGCSKSLEAMLKASLKKFSIIKHRREALDADGEEVFRFVNHTETLHGTLCGEFVEYAPSRVQAVASIKLSAEAVPLKAMKLEDGEEFIDKILYFLVDDNRLIVAQSQMRSSQLERHLTWLLRSTGQLSEQSYVMLVDEPRQSLQKEIDDTDTISFSAPVQFTPTVQALHDDVIDADLEQPSTTRVIVPEENKGKIDILPGGKGWDALLAFLPPGLQIPETLGIDDIVVNRELEVKLEVRWKRSGKEEPGKLLDVMSNQLRHLHEIPELDFKVKTKTGKEFTKNEFHLGKHVHVERDADGFVNRSDLWEQMWGWLRELLSNEAVE